MEMYMKTFVLSCLKFTETFTFSCIFSISPFIPHYIIMVKGLLPLYYVQHRIIYSDYTTSVELHVCSCTIIYADNWPGLNLGDQ